MRQLVIFVKFQAFAATGFMAMLAIAMPPALAQEAEGGEVSTSVEVVEPVVEEEEPSIEAVTADDPDISTDKLEVLLKPLTQEEVQAEADAWYGLLQEKAQKISDLEYDIKIREEKISGDVDSTKEKKVVEATELKAEQTILISRLGTVLDDLESKGGDPTLYRQYAAAVGGLEFNITDTEGLGLRFKTWLQSEEGGIRWGLNLLKVGGILIAAAVIAPRAGKLTDIGLSRVENISTLFRGFIVMSVKRSVLVVGALLSLAAIGVNLGPILAVVGGASFVLAFALQSNLGNFASGLMLLINKPFDVGDEVQLAGYWAKIHSISLANTKLQTFGGSLVTLPNNTVWGGDIVNHTHADLRKVSFSTVLKFTQDLDKIQEIWLDIVQAHPKVLKDPAPGIFPWSSAYNYKMDVGLNAWTKTSDYWGVYVDLLKAVQNALQENNIELVAPVQEIKLDGATSQVIDVKGSSVADALPQGAVNH